MDDSPDSLKRAKAIAFRSLGRQAATEQSIRTRLLNRQFDEAIVEAVIRDLKRLRLVDDAAFAREYVEEQMRQKPMGRDRLQAELVSKGVSDEIAAGIVDEAMVGFDPMEAAVRALRGKLRSYERLEPEVALRRMVSFLRGRGFDDRTAVLAVREIWESGNQQV